jgi:integrase
MPTVKFTPANIAKLKAPSKSGRQEIVWDSELKGFGVLLSGTTNVRTFIVQRKLPDRRTRRVTVGAANVLSLDDARRKALEVLQTFADGKDPKAERKRKAGENVTLAEALAKFLTDRDVSASVRNRWPQYFALYLADWLDKPLRAIDAGMVTERRLRIMHDVRRRGRPRSAAAVTPPGSGAAGLTVRAFRTVRNHVAEAAGLPALKIKEPAPRGGDKRRERMLRSEEMPAFFAAVRALDNPRDRDLIRLLLWTGLRFGEASSLRWADIDLPQRAIRIPAAATKPRRRLDLPMTTPVRALLIARRAVGLEGQYVFPAIRRTNSAAHVTDLTGAFDRIAETCGVRVSPHDLRRGWATVAADCNISGLALKAMLNHALPADVSAGYVRLTIDQLREPAQRVADRISELCGVEAPEGVVQFGRGTP